MNTHDTQHPSNAPLTSTSTPPSESPSTSSRFDDLELDRRTALKGGGLLLTAAAAGTIFAPAVQASTRAKSVLTPPPGPFISGFTPMSASPGDLVTIDISGFTGVVPKDLCSACEGDHFGFSNVISADDTQVVVQMTAFEPGFVAAPILIMQGSGTLSNPAPPPNTNILAPVFSWIGNPGAPSATSTNDFTLAPTAQTASFGGTPCPFPAPPATVCSDFWSNAAGGQLTVDIQFGGSTCPTGTVVDLHVHGLQTSSGSSFNFDYHSCLAFTAPLDLDDCVATICAVYQQAFFDNHGVFFSCSSSDNGGNNWTITLSPALGETFTGGWLGFRICTP